MIFEGAIIYTSHFPDDMSIHTASREKMKRTVDCIETSLITVVFSFISSNLDYNVRPLPWRVAKDEPRPCSTTYTYSTNGLCPPLLGHVQNVSCNQSSNGISPTKISCNKTRTVMRSSPWSSLRSSQPVCYPEARVLAETSIE